MRAVQTVGVIRAAVRVVELILVDVIEVRVVVLQLIQLHQVLRIQLGDSQFEEGILIVD